METPIWARIGHDQAPRADLTAVSRAPHRVYCGNARTRHCDRLRPAAVDRCHWLALWQRWCGPRSSADPRDANRLAAKLARLQVSGTERMALWQRRRPALASRRCVRSGGHMGPMRAGRCQGAAVAWQGLRRPKRVRVLEGPASYGQRYGAGGTVLSALLAALVQGVRRQA